MRSRRLDIYGNYHYDWRELFAALVDCVRKGTDFAMIPDSFFYYKRRREPFWFEWLGLWWREAKCQLQERIFDKERRDGERRYLAENPLPPDPEGNARDYAAMQEAFQTGTVPSWWLKGEAKP